MQLEPGAEVCRGKYRLLRLLGEGGFAQVFEAENVATKRRFALKAVQAALVDQEAVERLRREAVVSSRVRHPHIVDVYDLEEDNGILFLVMEYVRGETLREALDRTRLPLDSSLTMLIAIMRGLSVMHRRGIVHRDIKPENIYLARQDDHAEIVPKLLDFGICKVVQPDSELPALTRKGTQAMGTALYMSPEQYADSAGVDARADIYALGVVLYECITGQAPYDGATQRDLLLKMLTTEPPAVTALRPELPSGLDAIVVKAMAKDAAERYPSLDELIEALTPFAATQLPMVDAILAARSSLLPPMAAKKPSSGWLITLSALIVVQVLGIYWAATTWQGGTPESVLAAPRQVLAGFFLPRTAARENAPLPRVLRDASIDIVCDIPGAELYVNGERVGVVMVGAPIHLRLPPGLYRFEALRDGVVLASDVQLVQAGRASALSLRAPHESSGPLQANAPPPALVSTAPRAAAELDDYAPALTEQQLSDVIESHLASLQACYESALQDGGMPEDPASLELALSIAAHGDVTSVRTQGSALAGLDACFEREAKTWLFPRAGRATQLRFPLVFRRLARSQLSSAQLSAVVTRSKSMLQRCYAGADRVLKLEVDMEVLPSGAVSSVQIDGDAPGVDTCIARTVRGWQFPTALEATRTRFPVLLMPGA
ncbi:MAG TPA: protein kinase [Polyangiales bacterium]|nr:protein kinase [Polyangiales bacterium]